MKKQDQKRKVFSVILITLIITAIFSMTAIIADTSTISREGISHGIMNQDSINKPGFTIEDAACIALVSGLAYLCYKLLLLVKRNG